MPVPPHCAGHSPRVRANTGGGKGAKTLV